MPHREPPSTPAKIAAPAIPNACPRARLFRALDEARRAHPITWVTAPAGAGKTTLAASYLASRKLPCLWYQIDSGDRDLASFFHFLGLAVARAAPRFRRRMPHLTPEYFGGVEIFARNFFRELVKRLRPPFILVFDNLQEVAPDATLHGVLCAALAELPRGSHAILISRASAPAAYARLRVNRQLVEIDWPQLRLREVESRALAKFLGREPRSAPIDDLHRLCEGWISGLILLLELAPASGDRWQEMRGAHTPALFDYFAAEVFSRRPPAVRDFLMLTALLPNFSARMAARLTGCSEAEALLRDLVRQNHFTELRSESPNRYQYHALFREFLLAQGRAAWGRAERAQQQRRAAVILQEAGLIEEALPLFLESGDAESAARLIRVRAEHLASAGRHATLVALLEALPISSLEEDPWLRYWYGVARLIPAPDEARTDLETAWHQFDAANDAVGLYLTWTAIAESYFTEYRNYVAVDRWIPAFESLRERFPDFPSPQVEARVLSAAIGVLQQRFINHLRLPGLAERLAVLLGEMPDVNQRILLGLHSLFYYLSMGDADRAERLLRLMQPSEPSSQLQPLVRLTWHTSGSLVAWCRGNARACLRHAEAGLAVLDEHGLPPVLRVALFYQAVYGSLVRGDTRSASSFLQRMSDFVTAGDDIHVGVYRHCSAMTAAHRGDLAEAYDQGILSVSLAERAGVMLGYFCNLYATANIALLRDDENGWRLLAAARALAVEKGSRYLECVCRFSEGAFLLPVDRSRALAALRDALAMSRELNGPSNPWLPHRVLARAYGAALEEGIEPEHVKELISRFEVAATDEVLHVDAWPWPIKVYTLGRFTVVVDGRALKFSAKAQKKPLDLLKALIALGGRHVREDLLIETLWPDAEANRASLALTTTLHRLRRLIGNKAIERREGRITLNARECWVDLWSLERLLTTAERTCRTASADVVETLAENLSALYRGAFLSDHDEHSWLLTTRERIRDKVIRAFAAAADALVRAERYEQAVRCLQRSLEAEPLAESTYRRLMQVYLAREERSEALATYRRCRQMLAAHFGVEPSPDTEAVGRRISPA